MATRPFAAHSEAELLDLRRRHEHSVRGVERERDNYFMNHPSPSNAWQSEGFRNIEDRIKTLTNEVLSIDRELAVRRSERG